MYITIRWSPGWRLRIVRDEKENILIHSGTTVLNLSDSELNNLEDAIKAFREAEKKKEDDVLSSGVM